MLSYAVLFNLYIFLRVPFLSFCFLSFIVYHTNTISLQKFSIFHMPFFFIYIYTRNASQPKFLHSRQFRFFPVLLFIFLTCYILRIPSSPALVFQLPIMKESPLPFMFSAASGVGRYSTFSEASVKSYFNP